MARIDIDTRDIVKSMANIMTLVADYDRLEQELKDVNQQNYVLRHGSYGEYGTPQSPNKPGEQILKGWLRDALREKENADAERIRIGDLLDAANEKLAACLSEHHDARGRTLALDIPGAPRFRGVNGDRELIDA